MPANQTYSTRIHSRRQLGRANEHLREAAQVLNEVGCRYADALPLIGDASIKVIDMLKMAEALIEDMRINI